MSRKHVTFVPLNDQFASTIASWHYPGPYSFYYFANDPDDLMERLDPQNWIAMYHTALDEHGDLVGFLQIKHEETGIGLGLGLRPGLTGQGLGTPFLRACLDFARQRHLATRFRLAVASFNHRAIKVYERAGFEKMQVFMHQTNGRDHKFILMERPHDWPDQTAERA